MRVASEIRLAVLATVALVAGCASVAADRQQIEKLPAITLVHVATPPIAVSTFWRRFAEVSPSVMSGVIADSEGAPKSLQPPAVPDFGEIISDKFAAQLAAQRSWWPKMTVQSAPVTAKYVQADGPTLRLTVEAIQIAASGRLLLAVQADLSRMPGNPLWSDSETFSGLINGGEKVDMDLLAKGDQSQIRKEMDRAADVVVAKLIASLP